MYPPSTINVSALKLKFILMLFFKSSIKKSEFIKRIWTVIKEDSSLARNKIAFATSYGWPTLPSIWILASASVNFSQLPNTDKATFSDAGALKLF